MSQANDLSRSLVPFEQATTLVAVIELSQSSWLIAGTMPGVERQPLKKIVPDGTELLRVLHRWRDEATRKVAPLHASPLPSRRDVTGFGWHDGCPVTGSRRTSSIRTASRSRASTNGPRRIGSTRPC